VAHNLNNLLAVILPTLDLLHENVDAAGMDLLNDALKATLRASKVVGQLMVFAGKRQAAKAVTVEFGKLVEEAVGLSRRSLPSPIALEFVDETSSLLVRCDPDGFSEVVTNLIVNARDALVQARTPAPRIEVRIEAAQPSFVRALGSSEMVRLTVTDNGPGIPEAVRQRVFDPFFTTKGPQSGTGLGLAISWSMVRAAGGTMACESVPGAGATFIVELPVSEPHVEARSPSPAPERAAAGLRVLLVDDDEAVRRTTRLSLTRGQHSVAEAASGAEALAVAGTQPFDVVLLDQALPDCLGTDIVEDLGARLDGAKILLFTGQDVDGRAVAGVEGVVHKPLRTKELLDVLAKLAASS
jgi:CheY-like chemotaxis protein